MPDPIRALDGAQRDFESGVELEVSGEVFVFDRHVYDFQAPESLTDSSDFLTYKLLCQGAGLGLESMYQDGTYREYALVWEDYVLGYLTTDVGCWTLYIPDSLELDDSPSESGESSGGSGGISDMDLSDPDVVDAGAFRMIVNAALIARYGLPVLGIQKRRAGV